MAWKLGGREKVGCTGCATAETKDPSTLIALAYDGMRPTNAGDADDMEPLALCVSGLERAGAVATNVRHGTWVVHGTGQ